MDEKINKGTQNRFANALQETKKMHQNTSDEMEMKCGAAITRSIKTVTHRDRVYEEELERVWSFRSSM